MTQEGHLQNYVLTLTTQTPVFIGSGSEYTKTDYVFNQRDNMVSVIDREKLFAFLAKGNFADKYEKYILSGKSNMYSFLKNECGLLPQEMKDVYKYTIPAGDGVDADHALKNIKSFMRNAKDEAYIPGSSIKGALRTVILYEMIKTECSTHDDIFLNRRETAAAFERVYLSKLYFPNAKNQNPMLNDLLRGVSISDSTVIPETDMTLSLKTDISTSGGKNVINVCRECLRPGTTVTFALTLDTSVLHGKITAEFILNAINDFSQYYQHTFATRFRTPGNAADFSYDGMLILGGGAGYFSKTVTYPYAGYQTALEKVAPFMEASFPRHNHDKDIGLGVSPHMLKYGPHNNALYPYGLCEVAIR